MFKPLQVIRGSSGRVFIVIEWPDVYAVSNSGQLNIGRVMATAGKFTLIGNNYRSKK